MPLTHQDNGVSMGGTLKDVSTQKKIHNGGLKRPAKLIPKRSPSSTKPTYDILPKKRKEAKKRVTGLKCTSRAQADAHLKIAKNPLMRTMYVRARP